jgi:hypothetical protein
MKITKSKNLLPYISQVTDKEVRVAIGFPTDEATEFGAKGGLNNLFNYILSKNLEAGKNDTTNYKLASEVAQRLDADPFFRLYVDTFHNIQDSIKAKRGVISFLNGGQYVYALWSKEETKKGKSVEGRFMAAALFRNGMFLGYEEAIIKESPMSLDVYPHGFYSFGMDKGGYLWFCMATLGYASKQPETMDKANIIELK